MLFVPKIQDGQNDQRRHKASHLAFPSASALQQQHRPAGRLRFFVRECSLFAGGTVDHLIGSRVRGMSPGSALLSWRDLRSTPDRRSPVSCFSFSDRVSVPDRRSFEARLSSPDRFSSLPIVVSVGLPRIMLDRARLSHESRPGGLAIWVGPSGAYSAIWAHFPRSLEIAVTVSFFPQSEKLGWSGKDSMVWKLQFCSMKSLSTAQPVMSVSRHRILGK
jgi:hypothetical protein